MIRLSERQKQLERELKQQKNIRIIRTDRWGLPVQKISTEYTTVKRTAMDILMKMILLTAEKLDVSNPAVIADFLAVDPLFTEDLCNKMRRTNMIKKEKDRFRLTVDGKQRLQEGMYEHPPESHEKIFIYSPCHEAILCEYNEENFAASSKRFRLAQDDGKQMADAAAVRSALEQSHAECGEDVLQTVIDEVAKPAVLAEQLAECLEFYLYNESEKIYFTRVWNSLIEQWDEQLEKMINDKDPLPK